MTRAPTGLGTHAWVERTGGRLTAAQRRSLLRPLAAAHVTNAAGRLSMLLRVNSGRRAPVTGGRRPPPDSALTRAAEDVARRRLSPALLNHSYRTFAFGAALGELENVDVDRELLFAAALLHDVGLPTPVPYVDFTRASAWKYWTSRFVSGSSMSTGAGGTGRGDSSQSFARGGHAKPLGITAETV